MLLSEALMLSPGRQYNNQVSQYLMREGYEQHHGA
jgi:hypothetical protein